MTAPEGHPDLAIARALLAARIHRLTPACYDPPFPITDACREARDANCLAVLRLMAEEQRLAAQETPEPLFFPVIP